MVICNALEKKSAGNWGPNATFLFPAKEGTGGIWKAVASHIPVKNTRFGEKGAVSKVDTPNKVIHVQDGTQIRYKNLVTTMSLDHLLEAMAKGNSETPGIQHMRRAAAEGLKYSSTIVLGIGIRGVLPPRIGDKCESRQLIYRAGRPSY
jgi:protoporphyrinogen oxidase